MATLVLSAVGTAFGGPIGGAIGAIIGQQVDQNILFKPKGREGPRLQELAVQTSSYGSQISRIFGRMRVAGTVIWATDLKETRSREGGGKGRPSTTIYSYSACFAVALSSRRIKAIGRIWADGKIFRGAAGDFKTETGFAFYPGGEDQSVDGLMASAEAGGGTPAYRGLALAVFEDMDLTEYGNRIPSLTFEVIGDDGSVAIADIIADISGQRIAMAASHTVAGFAAGGEDRLAALRPLVDAVPLSFSADPENYDRIEAEVRPNADAATAMTIDTDFVRAVGQQAIDSPELHSASPSAVPKQMSVRYYDPARDYQSGIQSAFRPGTGRAAITRDFPAALSADDARALALTGLWSVYGERTTLQVSVPLGSQRYRPAMLARFDIFGGLWRVRGCQTGSGIAQLSLARASAAKSMIRVESEQGRNIADPDLPAGPTRLVLVDLPFALEAPTTPSPLMRLYAAAAGAEGWRNAQLFGSGAGDAPGEYIGQIAAPTIMGTVSGTLGSASPALIDRFNHVDIELQHAGMALHLADDSQLLAGRNLAVIGQEIIQFSAASPLEDGRYRLSKLLRGLGGTEIEISRHRAAEDFVLLDAGSMLEIGLSLYTPFSPARVFALGRDDSMPVPAEITAPGRALLPWSPVHGSWRFRDDGDLEIGWTRRSRAGTVWQDNVEVPLAEESEKYRIALSASGAPETAIVAETSVPNFIFPEGQIEPLASNHITADIRQVGAHGLSDPLTLHIET